MAKCPHCEKEVTLDSSAPSTSGAVEVTREIRGNVKKEIMYSCPHCSRVLGFCYGRPWWMR